VPLILLEGTGHTSLCSKMGVCFLCDYALTLPNHGAPCTFGMLESPQ
jgi:hypothetical protein